MGLLSNIRTGIKRAFRLQEIAGGLIDPDDALYRALNEPADGLHQGQDRLRRERSRRLGPALYFRDALGGAVIDSRVDRVIGAGAQYKAADDAVQEVVDHFVGDADNDLDEYLETYAKELEIYGELVLPIYLTPENADVRLGYLEPLQVETVIFQNGNRKRALAVIQKPVLAAENALLWIVPHPSPQFDGHYPPHPAIASEEAGPTEPGADGLPVLLPTGADGKVLPEIEDVLKRPNMAVGGYAFYHRNNSLVSGRGRSTYERIQDWLKGLNDWFFGELRKAVLQGLLVAHVQIAGADKTTIDQRKKELARLPKPGSLLVTNEKETWNFLSANMEGRGPVRELLSGTLKMIGIATGIPPAEIGAEQDSNRSTAKEAGKISTNRAKRFQRKLTAIVLCWIGYQVDQKVYRGQLSASADRTVEVILPELDQRDAAEEAQSMQFAVQAMSGAVDSNLVLEEDARRYLYGLMGIDVPDPELFAQAAVAQAQKRDEALLATGGTRLSALMKQMGTRAGSDGSGPVASDGDYQGSAAQ